MTLRTSYLHVDFQKYKIRKKSSIKLGIFQPPGCQLEVVWLITVIPLKVPMGLSPLGEDFSLC
jgi:hypothetical protein